MAPLTLSDLLEQAKNLNIASRKLSNSVAGGQFLSAFKGRGMSFKEVREYVPGDDPRFIDWNTSARLGDTFTKVFDEDKDFLFLLLVDGSTSGAIGSGHLAKFEYAAQLVATIGLSALDTNVKTGMLLFTDQIEQYIPPGQGKEHYLRMLTQLVKYKSANAQTDLAKALQFVINITKQTAIVFVLSDFETEDPTAKMKILASRHDCIAMHVYDNLDLALPGIGLVPVRDSEQGNLVWIDSSDKHARALLYQQQQQRLLQHQQQITSCGWDYIRLRTDMDYADAMQTFLRKRTRGYKSR